MSQLLQNPLVPIVILLILIGIWIFIGYLVVMTKQEDIAIGHSDWPVDLTDFRKIIVKVDLPVPYPKVSIYSQVVAKYNIDPLGT